jgi:hypothetical protein
MNTLKAAIGARQKHILGGLKAHFIPQRICLIVILLAQYSYVITDGPIVKHNVLAFAKTLPSIL